MSMWRLARTVYFTIAIVMAVMISLKALEFLNPEFENHHFLTDKQGFFNFYRWPLYVHLLTAPLSILFGVIQYSLPKKGLAHRIVGTLYTIIVLFFAAPSGLVMAFFAIGGVPSVISFVLLSVLWWWFTAKAYRFARSHDYEKHKHFITSSFILANSAIVLRLLGFVNKQWLHLDYETAYILMAWLSWLPFLLIYQLGLWLNYRRKSQ